MLLFKVTYRIALLLAFSGSAIAQVQLDKPLVFTAPASANQQVYGVAYPTNANNAANSYAVQYGQLVYDETADVDILSIGLSPALTSYTTGMQVHVKLTSSNTGAVTLNIDGLGAVPVTKHVNQALTAGDIPAGAMVQLLYDGTNFQLMNTPTSKDCPSGFVEVNSTYCIEVDERPAELFWNANKTCGDLGGVICTWTHWYYACQKAGLGVNNMTDNWEWVDDADDHASHASLVGELGCTKNQTGNTLVPTNTYAYRCCYYK